MTPGLLPSLSLALFYSLSLSLSLSLSFSLSPADPSRQNRSRSRHQQRHQQKPLCDIQKQSSGERLALQLERERICFWMSQRGFCWCRCWCWLRLRFWRLGSAHRRLGSGTSKASPFADRYVLLFLFCQIILAHLYNKEYRDDEELKGDESCHIVWRCRVILWIWLMSQYIKLSHMSHITSYDIHTRHLYIPIMRNDIFIHDIFIWDIFRNTFLHDIFIFL